MSCLNFSSEKRVQSDSIPAKVVPVQSTSLLAAFFDKKRRSPKLKTCDICGRDESALFDESPETTSEISPDDDGLWVCGTCRSRVIHQPADTADEGELDEALRLLVGKSAGAICRTLELPYVPPYQAIMDAAAQIGYDEDRYMSTWSFLIQWLDGTTVWQSEDKTARALVYPNGDVQVDEI
jgi:hypothetical protein